MMNVRSRALRVEGDREKEKAPTSSGLWYVEMLRIPTS